jgi:hypothetical protein
MAIHGLLDALDLNHIDSGADDHAVYKATSILQFLRLREFCSLSIYSSIADQPVETMASNYQRMGSPKPWKARCVKDGQGPLDFCTIVMLSSPAPIRPL